MSYSSIQVANEFLKIAKKHKKDISPLKMQKLVYFAHGWSLAILDEPLIDEQVEAWKFGPVINTLYHEFKHYGNRPITEPGEDALWSFYDLDTGEYPDKEIRDEEILELLETIWEVYGDCSPIELSQMTHEENTPWAKIFKRDLPRNTDIPLDDIKNYFKLRLDDI